MFRDTITLFNRKHSRSGDVWYPHVIHNVEIEKNKAGIAVRFGAESTDNAMLVINYENSDDGIRIDGLPYLPPKQWSLQPDNDFSLNITFNDNAQYFDFFIEGEYSDSLPVNDSDYKSGFYNHMNNTYDYCYAITGVGGPYKLIPHFEIMAK